MLRQSRQQVEATKINKLMLKRNRKHIQGGHKPQKIKRRMCKMNNIHDKAKAILEVSKQQDNSNEYLLAMLIAEIENLTTVIKYKPQ